MSLCSALGGPLCFPGGYPCRSAMFSLCSALPSWHSVTHILPAFISLDFSPISAVQGSHQVLFGFASLPWLQPHQPVLLLTLRDHRPFVACRSVS